MGINFLRLFAFVFFVQACTQRQPPPEKTSLKTGVVNPQDTSRIESLLRKGNRLRTEEGTDAENYYKQAISESLKARYYDGVIEAVLKLMSKRFEAGKFDSGEYYYGLAEKWVEKVKFHPNAYSQLMLNKGTFYYLHGDWVNADKTYYNGLQQAKAAKPPDHGYVIRFLYNLYFTKLVQKEPAIALQYINEAEVVSKANKNDFLNSLLAAKADIYLSQGKLDSVKKIVSEILKQEKPGHNEIIIASSFYEKMNQPELAVPILKQGIKEAEKNKLDFATSILHVQLGKIYRKLKRFEEAEEYLMMGLNESVSKKFQMSIGDAYKELTAIYTSNGQYEKAFNLQKQQTRWRDTILTTEKTKALNELNIRYRTVEKDNEIAKNKLELVQQQNAIFRKNSLILAISGIAVLLLLLVYILVKSARQKEQLRKHEISLLKQQQEIERLYLKSEGEELERERLSKELHDGIGSMVSSALVQLDALEKNVPQVVRDESYSAVTNLLGRTANDIRKTANDLLPDNIIRLGFKEAVEDYLRSIQISSGLTIKPEIHGDLELINSRFQLIVYRIIQELMHNTIKHAQADTALVQIILNDQCLEITVEDNGKGFDNSKSHTGKGIRNIKQRVRQLNGAVTFERLKPTGTSVYIEIDKTILVG